MKTSTLPVQILTDKFAARLYRYIRFNGSCWDFNGTIKNDGYPRIKVGKRPVSAHRASYYLHKGLIPEGMLVCHKCDNPKCINPLHLFLGTVRDNTIDALNKGRLETGAKGFKEFRKRVTAGEATLSYTGNPGEKNPQSKLTEADVVHIRTLHSAGIETYGTLAERFAVTRTCIAFVCQRRSWNHIP